MLRTSPSPIRLSVACYRLLLMAYPTAYRQIYGPLMQQLFQDLCRDAYQQNGWRSLIPFWIRTLLDFAQSVGVTYWETMEAFMAIKRPFTPMPWRYVLLVVLPGVLFGISRLYYPFYLPFQISLILIILWTLATLVTQKQIPGWGLLMAGLVISYGLLAVNIVGGEWIAKTLHYNDELKRLLGAIPLWAVIVVMGWQHRQVWRSFSWALGLLLLVILVTALFVGMSALTTAGFMLLPVALGLPLARRHGAAALLFVVGAYSVWLFDSDTFNGWWLRDKAFYPVYAMLLLVLFMAAGPLLFLRATTLRGQIVGLFTPMILMLVARVLVPWLIVPFAHPARIWRNDALLSAFTLLVFILGFVLYARVDRVGTLITSQETDQPIYAG